MGFFRENGLKFMMIFIVVVVITVVFTFMFSGRSKKIKTYNDMEVSLKEAAVKYVNSNKSLLPKDETSLKKINLDTLVNEKKIKQLFALDDENIACTGYVTIIKKEDSYVFTPYIKCGKYYETKTIAKYIIDNEEIKQTDDGLYNYSGLYVFRGENPNNYVKLSDKLYRIIEINSDNELKLISLTKTEDDYVWDDRYNSEKDDNYGLNNFSKSRLKDSLNEIYKSDFFTAQDREKIVKHSFCVGKKALADTSLDGKAECSITENDLYVGLIQSNEYARASLDEKCNATNRPECQNYNYLSSLSYNLRTITALSDNTYQVYNIRSGESLATNCNNSFLILPVVYIDKNALYQGGKGTKEEPYLLR